MQKTKWKVGDLAFSWAPLYSDKRGLLGSIIFVRLTERSKYNHWACTIESSGHPTQHACKGFGFDIPEDELYPDPASLTAVLEKGYRVYLQSQIDRLVTTGARNDPS